MAEIAIIMPTYHRPVSLRIAIDSIINQTFKNWKLYVIGDGCSDNTEKIMAEYIARHGEKIVWRNLRMNHGGGHHRHGRGDSGASCRNMAFHISKEPYIAYLDDDDRYYKNHLQTLYDSIVKKAADFVYSQGYFFTSARRNQPPFIVGTEPPKRTGLGTNAIMHTRDIANKILKPPRLKSRRIDPILATQKILWLPARETQAAHDWDMINRMLKKGAKYKFIEKPTYEAYWGYSQTELSKMPRIPRFEGIM